MLTLRNFVGLAASLCLGISALNANSQSMKIASRTSSPAGLVNAPAAAAPMALAGSNLDINCQTQGPAVLEFLLATVTGGTPPYNYTGSISPTGAAIYPKKNSLFASVPISDAPSGGPKKTDTFTVTVRDKKGTPVTKSCPITVNDPPVPGALNVGCSGVGHVGAAFPAATVSGGTEPYSYTASNLPKPLVLVSSSGLVTGASTPGVVQGLKIKVVDKDGSTGTATCSLVVLPQPNRMSCAFLPVAHVSCVGYDAAKNANINAFWETNGNFVFFNQVKSIYSGASNSETISADVGTLNFPIGMQLNIGTNIQAGATPPTAVVNGVIPTLSPTAAAQAAENMLYGGTIYASGAYPIFAFGGNRINSPGNVGGMLDLSAREGVDIQSFKAGTSTSANTPASHTTLQAEGYVQMNSTNLPTVGGGTFAGALFAGGSWGYSYTAHQYIRDYGIKNAVNRLGQWSAGIILNGVAKLAFSKAYGPLQTYYDGTLTPLPTTATTVNNFKAWSFELTYQAPAPK